MSGKAEFVFVIWEAARRFEPDILRELGRKFRIVSSREMSWPRRHFASNLAAFYGWKSWRIWRNKARKCGTGPFRVVVVEDPSPVWKRERDTFGHSLVVDENVHSAKKAFREMTGRSNSVHSSVTEEETAHQLAALESPVVEPIPFTPMVYEDDACVRLGRRRVWLGLAGDVLAPLAASVASGLAVWTEVSVLGARCNDCGFVEMAGFAVCAAGGALMTACAFASKSGRGAHALVAALFFDMAVREADLLLDRALGVSIWPWAPNAVTVAFAAVAIRYGKTVYSGLRAMRRSRRFPLFACGVSLLIFVAMFLGRPGIWEALGAPDAQGFGRFVEDGIELFGFALMFVWAASHAARVFRMRGRH